MHHGFPDDAHLWEKVVPFLIPTGHSLIIPDMLGYGDSDKPEDTAEYCSKSLVADM